MEIESGSDAGDFPTRVNPEGTSDNIADRPGPGEKSYRRGKEGVSRSTFYRWKDRLTTGIPESMVAEKETRERAEAAAGAAFVPISLKASPVEIQLPNGGVVRLPLSVGQAVLVEVIRAAGALRPSKEPSHE